MGNSQNLDIAHQIANDHGVDIQPGANGATVLVVQARYRAGDLADRRLIEGVRIKLAAAGISHAGWLS